MSGKINPVRIAPQRSLRSRSPRLNIYGRIVALYLAIFIVFPALSLIFSGSSKPREEIVKISGKVKQEPISNTRTIIHLPPEFTRCERPVEFAKDSGSKILYMKGNDVMVDTSGLLRKSEAAAPTIPNIAERTLGGEAVLLGQSPYKVCGEATDQTGQPYSLKMATIPPTKNEGSM